MARTMGATLVGMSTVLEAIAAPPGSRSARAQSRVDFAAGVAAGALNHLEVLEAGENAASSLGALLTNLSRTVNKALLAEVLLWIANDPDPNGRRNSNDSSKSTTRRNFARGSLRRCVLARPVCRSEIAGPAG